MSIHLKTFIERWRRFKSSRRFHNVLTFLIFVCVATVFWLIVALNDSVTETFTLKISLNNVPDSVTFINEPPKEMFITVKDKGTNILRSGLIKKPEISIDFNEFAHEGIFRLSQSELMGRIKESLGGAVQISSLSLDSLRLYYTDQPGRIVPVVINYDVSAANGYTLSGEPICETKSVRIFSYGNEIDTVRYVVTHRLAKYNLTQTTDVKAKLVSIPHVRIIPAEVMVKIGVESLVSKEVFVPIEVINQPEDESLMLFPNKVQVSCFVPMSRYNDDSYPIRVIADFNEISHTSGSRVSLRVAEHDSSLANVTLLSDSVDYTLVKN